MADRPAGAVRRAARADSVQRGAPIQTPPILPKCGPRRFAVKAVPQALRKPRRSPTKGRGGRFAEQSGREPLQEASALDLLFFLAGMAAFNLPCPFSLSETPPSARAAFWRTCAARRIRLRRMRQAAASPLPLSCCRLCRQQGAALKAAL